MVAAGSQDGCGRPTLIVGGWWPSQADTGRRVLSPLSSAIIRWMSRDASGCAVTAAGPTKGDGVREGRDEADSLRRRVRYLGRRQGRGAGLAHGGSAIGRAHRAALGNEDVPDQVWAAIARISEAGPGVKREGLGK